jgi:hypothetical protein
MREVLKRKYSIELKKVSATASVAVFGVSPNTWPPPKRLPISSALDLTA